MKRIKSLIILLIACSFLFVACGPNASQLASTYAVQTMAAASPTSPPTNTPLPSNTPLPTDTATPVPTDTPTPLPTNTPTQDLQATQAFEATRIAEQAILDIKAQLTELGFPSDVGRLGWIQQETEKISLDTYGQYLYSPFAEDLVASDFIINTDITWETEGLVLCGLMFRSESNFETGAQYNFMYLRISGLPAWAIEYYDNGDFVSTVTDIKFSSAIKMDNGATNNLIMAAEGNKFTLFINQERLGSFYDWSDLRKDGKFAYQGSQETGPSTCTFDNTWVWMLK